MSTKTAKTRTSFNNGTRAAKHSNLTNGALAKKPSRKKSIREQWIEKYGVDDSPLARKTLEMWEMVYEANNKPKS